MKFIILSMVAAVMSIVGVSSPANAATCNPPSGAVSTINSHQYNDADSWVYYEVVAYIGCYPRSDSTNAIKKWDKANGETLYVYFMSYDPREVKGACATTGSSCWIPA